MSKPRTIIVGGGVIGLCAAYFLARRGAPVTLLERWDFQGSASTGNAGLVSLGHAPLPRPGRTARALRWMFDPTSPLYIPPRADFELLRWLWRFHRACRRTHFRRSMDVLAAHGRAAGACLRGLVETESIDCGYRRVGQLEVCRTDAGLRAAEHEAEMLRGYGYDVEIVSGDALREREPAFRPEVVGAAWYHDSAFADPGAFVAGVAEAARRHGADLRVRTTVRALLVEGGRCAGVVTGLDSGLEGGTGERLEADRVILAGGIWSAALARDAGVRVPMQAAKGYHVDLTAPAPCPGIACVMAERFVAATPMAGGLRLAGTLELSGVNHRLVPRRVEMLPAAAREYLHGVEAAEMRSAWCGLRPCTADGLPVVGWAPRVRDLFVATGHAMMGFTLGPLAGRIAAECVLGDDPSVDIAPLRADRFGPA